MSDPTFLSIPRVGADSSTYPVATDANQLVCLGQITGGSDIIDITNWAATLPLTITTTEED